LASDQDHRNGAGVWLKVRSVRRPGDEQTLTRR